MIRWKSRPFLLAVHAPIVAVAVLFGSNLERHSALAQDAEQRTVLEFAGPEEVPLGNVARLIVILKDSNGEPIPGATVLFTMPASFAGAVSEMDLGKAVTEADGMALFDYQLRSEGTNQFIARFHGNAEDPPTEARTEVIASGSVQLAERSAGVQVPFFGSWTLIVIIVAVWSVYFLAMRLVSQIPEGDRRKNIGGAR